MAPSGAFIPARNQRLSLFGTKELMTMFARERASLRGGCRGTASVRDYPLEFDPFCCPFGGRRTKVARSAQRALPNLLATGFLVRLPARLFNGGRAGSHAGFLCEDTGAWLA